MADGLGFDFGQDDAEVLAFVLRVRRVRDGVLDDRMIVELTETDSMHTKRLTSLEDAFAEIRGALKLLGETSGSPDTSH